MVGDVTGSSVAAYERLVRFLTEVDDVAEVIAVRVLCPRPAQVQADAPVDQ
jgi:hypothetical protein